MARKRSVQARASTKGRSTGGKTRKRRTRGRKKEPLLRWPSLDTQLDILGVLLVGVGLVTGLSMLSPQNATIISAWLDGLALIFGWGMVGVPFLAAGLGIWLIARRFEFAPAVPWSRLLGTLLLGLIGLGTLTLVAEWEDPAMAAATGGAGGLVGLAVLRGLRLALGTWGALVGLVALSLIGALLTLELSLAELQVLLAQRRDRTPPAPEMLVEPALEPAPPPRIIVNNTPIEELSPEQGAEGQPQPKKRGGKSPKSRTGSARPRAPVADEVAQPPIVASANGFDWELPAWQRILEDVDEQDLNAQDIRRKVRIIEETLHNFGLPARVIEVSQGPTVTQFGIEPGFVVKRVRGEERRVKVKVSAITSLANDLALALAASSIRVEAPVPGRPFIGVEIPNEEKNVVSLKGIMETTEFQRIKSPLRVALGRDVSGAPVVAALDKMPHLLIAGATGSGKSVCVNIIIASLLCNNHPDQLKLLMVDPKMVELVGYNGIPHLIAPVVVDMERVVATLRWAVKEMERRYQLFSQVGARNVQSFNEKAVVKGEQPLPFIIIIIDELADLMMIAAEEVERLICRLAQMARATGMHLILATQRPSVDVVTGLIKANFPAR
ncbi:MAG TPA: cell division protein FtsK, partial [Chloroflexi bacterium]|nr:cell division protein FtsK [Chloroflexota bacterium]